jgi:hypothetical protein
MIRARARAMVGARARVRSPRLARGDGVDDRADDLPHHVDEEDGDGGGVLLLAELRHVRLVRVRGKG